MTSEYNKLKFVVDSPQSWTFANMVTTTAMTENGLTWLDKYDNVALCIIKNIPIYIIFPGEERKYIHIITTDKGVHILSKIRKGEKL